ncbi:hypothetical protein [Actinacidiphila paucisporea]|uniref:Secreted protein n=1 Tax=Actinacidiphila paucisporea TaxID=310782 RepID=A0A1M7P7E2_9ACTN|nr:hypothetical protein [Actinacidiphila paucisporea]SHN12629.1 hypothetical protein SAMN05216499_121112 [Actinacidiphila paucisporea]
MEQPTSTPRRLSRIRRSPVLRTAALAGALAALVATAGVTTAASAAPAGGATKHAPKAAQPLHAIAPTLLGGPVSVPPGGHGSAFVVCPGVLPSGGGGKTSGYDMFFTDSYADGLIWYVRATNTGTTTQTLTAFAVC